MSVKQMKVGRKINSVMNILHWHRFFSRLHQTCYLVSHRHYTRIRSTVYPWKWLTMSNPTL